MMPVVVLLIPAYTMAGQAEAFGRWQQRPRSCVVEQGASPKLRCNAVQLDQRSPEIVRLSVQAEGVVRNEWIQITLVGALAEGQKPMVCRNGACTLSQPLLLNLSTFSLARFNERGLAQTLPDARSVQGTCRIDPVALQCQVLGADQGGAGALLQWSIEADLR
jgi:hypothetical protein